MVASDQFAECYLWVSIGDDYVRADLFARFQFHADYFFALDENPLHATLEPDLTARAFQRPDECARQRERATQRIISAVEIMTGDARVHEGRPFDELRASLRRRQGACSEPVEGWSPDCPANTPRKTGSLMCALIKSAPVARIHLRMVGALTAD